MVLVIIFCVNPKHFLHSRNVKNSKKTTKQMLHFSPLFLSLLCVALMSILKDTDRVSGDHLKGECHHKSLVCWRSLQGLPALYNIWPFWSSVLQNTQVFILLLFFYMCRRKQCCWVWFYDLQWTWELSNYSNYTWARLVMKITDCECNYTD